MNPKLLTALTTLSRTLTGPSLATLGSRFLNGTVRRARNTMMALLSAALVIPSAALALNSGELMFTAMNADEDGFAMVALAPIPANTTVYFTDNEWDGTVFNTGESYSQWVSGASVISAGTVIRFIAVDTVTPSASLGTFSRATVSGSTNWGLSTGEDSIYAYQATSVSSAPSVFLSAICNTSFGTATAGVLTNTGLSVGSGAIQTAFSGGSDFAEYNGTRTGQATFAAYLPIVSNVANWTVDTANGVFATTIPNTTSFTIAAATPVVTGTATAAAFTTTYGTASAVQTFPVTGSNLTANIIATAPTGFQIASDGATYGSTATFTQSGGGVTGTLSVRLAATAPVVGTYNTVNITLASTGATTINITTAASGNAVSTKALSITANNVTKSLGATLTSSAGSVAFSSVGLVGIETIGSVTITYGSGAAAVDPAGSYPGAVVASAATGGTFVPSNYTINYVAGDIIVSPAVALTISGLTADNKAYDRTTTATLSGTPALVGVLPGDVGNVTLSGTPVPTFATVTVGTAKAVTVTGYTLSGSAAAGYTLSQPSGLTADITPLALTVSGAAVTSKAYDGNTTATITGTLTGVLAPDVVTFNGTGTFASSAVGNGIAVTSTSTLGGANAANYSLTQPTGLTGNITAPAFTGVDLSTYVRIGRYNLPEPTRTTPPTDNLLCQEASGVAYNYDTDTLFIACDGGKSVTQVSKTGVLIDTMTLALGSSPQGTEFYDTEGITYIGGGQFVMTEERDRQLVKFTYAAGTTLTRGATQTVKLGTFSPNEGTEGLSYDPQTNGYICLKEINPIGIFQTGVDFGLGTATNGSPSTVNSTNLFDPALLGMTDVADVFALSNLPALTGQPQSGNLLVLSQENAKIVNIDRTGVITSSLQIVSDPGNPLTVANQQHEGLTMDRDGILYVVSENGGGDIDHPQLWVYAPSSVPNAAPTAVALSNTVTSILENTSTTTPIKVGDIVITDDGLGTNNLTLTGADAASFEITTGSLYIKAGVVLDYETKTSYSVTVNVDDATVGSNPDASVSFTLNVTDVLVETPAVPALIISEVAPWSSTNGLGLNADWFEVTNTGTTAVNITGWKIDDNSNSFAAALALTGITSIAPGESVIFIESGASNQATLIAAFKTLWFGASPPAALQIGTYTGSGIGLSSTGDAVNLYNAAGVLQANVVFGASPASAPFATFNNGVGLNNATISLLSVVNVHGAFVATSDANEIGSPGTTGKLIISEVAPWGSGATSYVADWFELTNNGARAVDVTGWKIDDNSNSFATAVPFNGITSIAPGESVIFMETATNADLAAKAALFRTSWFGASPPPTLQVGNYSGGGVGLSTGGDAVNIYDANGTLIANVVFGTATTNVSFDNHAGISGATISTLSVVNQRGAFVAASAPETGSPGTTGKLIVTEIAPWSSSNSPLLADWFEVTNTGTAVVDITGWKMDDNSESPVAAVPLVGITSIAPGESVIFIETATPVTTKPAFLTNWFGANPPPSLQVGSYTGSGVGLGSGGDAVNLYNSSGVRVSNIAFGASPASAPFTTFDNKAGLSVAITTTFSAAGVNGAFNAANSANEIGSPGGLVSPPSLPLFSFASATYSVNETSATVTLTINRAGTLSAASVNVSTANGTALSGTDYTALTNQTVSFIASQTTATVNVTVANSFGVRPNRVFTATLSNAVSATPATTTVTIVSVAPVQSWRQTYFGSTANTGNAANTADFDSDGISNLMEYALGINPTLGTGTNGLPALPVGVANDASDPLLSDRLSLSFVIDSPSPTDLSYTVQATEDLVNWTDVASKVGTGSWTWLGGGTSHIVLTAAGPRINVRVGDLVPMDAAHPQRSMRLKVSTP